MFEVALIGAGQMAAQIGRRLMRYGGFRADQLVSTHYDETKARKFHEQIGIHVLSDNVQAVRNCRLMVLCVRPQQVEGVIGEIAPHFCPAQQVCVYITVGVRLSWMTNRLKSTNVIHFHPTSMVMLTERWNPGTSLWVPHPHIQAGVEAEIREIFSRAIGDLLITTEKELPLLIFACGNAPAYLVRIVQALVNQVENRLPGIKVLDLFRLILEGLYTGLVIEKQSLEEVLQRIATRQGVTQAGLRVLDGALPALSQDLLNTTLNRIKEIESSIEKEDHVE